MKLVHLSDLHLGKRLREFSLIEDQAFILKKIVQIIDDEKPDAILIAGDVFDTAVASVEATKLFDGFLEEIAARKICTFIIAGNHDSADRLGFASELIKYSGIHISKAYDGKVAPITLCDEFGEVDFFLLPFIKPINVRNVFNLKQEDVGDYTDALEKAISEMQIDETKRNVLVAHQFVTGSSTCDSEEISIGGTENVDARVFDKFDYVALGHLHGPQKCSRETVRYCGTPLKYSFSEISHKKSVTVVELAEKGKIDIRTVPLKPLREMHVLTGEYEELLSYGAKFSNEMKQDDYYSIVLTDENEKIGALAELRKVFPNLMSLEYEIYKKYSDVNFSSNDNFNSMKPLDMFEEFFKKINGGKEMNKNQSEFMKSLIDEIWEAQK